MNSIVATDRPRIPLADADQVAREIICHLDGAYERILVVGSTRRRVETVHDVELLVVPKYVTQTTDLFGGATSTSALEERCSELRDTRVFVADAPGVRKSWGPRLKRFMYHGVQTELYIVLPPAQFGLACVIRTGPADYAHQLVTPRNRTMQTFAGGKRSGLCPPEFQIQHLGIYHGADLIPTPEESDVFRVLGVPTFPPESRR